MNTVTTACRLPTYSAIAALLDYPQAELLAALPELRAALQAEKLLPRQGLQEIVALCDYLGRHDLYTLQENYVSLFDRGRGHSLHLFEHVHGESRDRGQAMVDLQQLYAGQGLHLAAAELPDYLPVFLEFLSRQPRAAGTRTAGRNCAHPAGAGRAAGYGRQPLSLCVECAALAVRRKAGRRRIRCAGAMATIEADDFEAIDAAWAEEPVAFGGGCATPTVNPAGEAVIRFQPRAGSPSAAIRVALPFPFQPQRRSLT